MLSAQSTNRRTIVAKLEAGVDLIDAVSALCQTHNIHAGLARCFGTLRSAEVLWSAADGQSKTSVAGVGHIQIGHCEGVVSVFADDVLFRPSIVATTTGGFGLQTLARDLGACEAADIEVVIESWDDVTLERAPNKTSGRLELTAVDGAEPSEQKSATQTKETPKPDAGEAQSSLSWDAVIEGKPAQEDAGESAAKKTAEPTVDSTPKSAPTPVADPKQGDYLDHPKLGLCRVIKLERTYAHIKLPKGQIRKLALKVCEFEFAKTRDDGKNVFDVRIVS